MKIDVQKAVRVFEMAGSALIVLVIAVGWVFYQKKTSQVHNLSSEIEVLRNQVSTHKAQIKELRKKALLLKKYEEQDKKDAALGNYVIRLMDQVGTKITGPRKQITARTVVRVTRDIFETEEERRQFATLLAIESKFNNKSKSSVGAQGISQIMPKFAKSFAKVCGIKDYTKSDLQDLELNMTIGACWFKALLEQKSIKGNVSAALVAYNAGSKSAAFKQLRGLSNMNNETSNYVTRFTFLKGEVKRLLEEENQKKEAEKNVPKM